ncbi:MAG: hypothetical protein M3Q45_11880, partial [Chloroflexota bacterium]|nr:hypothetical protein [Chloroflexota bacterium]
LTRNRPAGFLAGCCFAFSGYLTGYAPLQLAILRTAAWLPLILWLLWRGFRQPPQWCWWVGGALALTSAFLAGHPQTFLYTAYTVILWVLLLWIQRWLAGEHSQPIHCALGIFACLVLTLLLSAAQLLPSLEFALFSVRANVDYAFVSGGFPVQDSWQLLLPGGLTQFSPLYIGIVGLGLTLITLGWRHAQAATEALQTAWIMRFFWGLTLLALLLSYGNHSFVYPLLYRFAPGWQLFRGQERAAFLVTLGLSVLAGYGLALIPGLPMQARRRLGVLLAVVTAGGVYAFGLLWQLLGRSAMTNNAYLVVALLTLLLAMALVVAVRLDGWSRRRTRLLIALVVMNLFWANFTTNLDSFSPTRKTMLAPEMQALQAAVAVTVAPELPGRVYNEFRLYEDYGIRQAIEDVWGSSPLRLADYAALFANFPLDRMWRLTGVTHVLTWRRELFVPSTVLAEFPQATDTTFLHQLRDPNPRAWVVHQMESPAEDEALRLLADHSFDLSTTALLPPGRLKGDLLVGGGPSQVELTRLANNRLHVRVEGTGFLVISENWMPGWRVINATCSALQGPATPCPQQAAVADEFEYLSVERTNLTLIGVLLPAAVTEFDLIYWPDSVRYGLWISGTTLAFLVLVGGWRLYQQRGSRQ